MKNSLLALVAVSAFLVVGTLTAHQAHAAPPATPRVEANKLTVKNLFVEPTATCTVDFAILVGNGVKTRESSTCSTGIVAGTVTPIDGCIVGTDVGMDGGVGPTADTAISCRATTDGCIFKARLDVVDAGTLDLASASYKCRIVH